MSERGAPRSPSTRSGCTRAAGSRTTTATSRVRDGNGRFLATPTATSKRRCAPTGSSSSTTPASRSAGAASRSARSGCTWRSTRAAADVDAVIHAHPPTATGFAVAGVPLDEAFIAEAVVSLGAGSPDAAVRAPGADAVRARSRRTSSATTRCSSAATACSRGAPTSRRPICAWSSSSTWRKIAIVARQLGGVEPLPAALLPKLLEARAKAGLGRGAAPGRTAATPARAGALANRGDAGEWEKSRRRLRPGPARQRRRGLRPQARPRRCRAPSPAELATIIRQEIAAALKSNQ